MESHKINITAFLSNNLTTFIYFIFFIYLFIYFFGKTNTQNHEMLLLIYTIWYTVLKLCRCQKALMDITYVTILMRQRQWARMRIYTIISTSSTEHRDAPASSCVYYLLGNIWLW